MTIRFALLVGVSSDVQARDDKGSLDDQIETCRRAIKQFGGIETGLYKMDGYSRSGYDALSDAMNDIPPLREAIEAAERNEYDVLMLDNWDRLGDLGQLVYTRFKKYKKQIHSARQSGKLIDPKEYDPYADESASIDIHIQGILQSYRINKLQRGLRLGITKRVETGKYSHRHPYGYIKASAKGDVEIDALVAQLLITLKDKFFEGLSLRDLRQVANESGIPSPKGLQEWDFMTIRQILANPFYAGKVFKNRWQTLGKKYGPTGRPYNMMRQNPNAILYDGNHLALWTLDEHLRIVTELDERYRKLSRHHPRAFTGLLVCSVCGTRLTFHHKKYECRAQPDHVRIPEQEAERGIGLALAEALRNYEDTPPSPPSLDVRQKVIDDLERQIIKVQRMTEKEIYTEAQGQERVRELRAQIAATEASHEQHQRQLVAHARLLEIRAGMLDRLDELPERFVTADKKVTNIFLRGILESIEVTQEREYKFNFR